jgi:predicted component of viral defense system (DUF524 family)
MIHWQEIVGTLVVWNVAAFALQTFPTPENKYARWFMGVLQFLVANKQKMFDAFQNSPKEGE